MKQKAFTLAEIMIVLMVIGILTAILLPSARNAMPNEDVMKFKKGHNALHGAIRELVTSDKYYLDGDLGIKADGTQLGSTVAESRPYFCETLAEILNAKEKQCFDSDITNQSITILNNGGAFSGLTAFRDGEKNGTAVTQETLAYSKNIVDSACKSNISKGICKQIVALDGIWYYDNSPGVTFGIYNDGVRHFSSPNTHPASIRDNNGFDTAYKIVCMDVDGIPENATKNDCINECPFGYGIRADGKILNGARADEWLQKSIQEK